MTEFIKTVAQLDQLPEHGWSEVALVGRSNAGKSSLLNSIVKRKKMAFVSSQPGKTRNLHFFNVDNKYVLVDLPGYGFAKLSKKDQGHWRELVEGYISQRESLVGIILVMDCRRKWTADEQMIVDWAESLNKGGMVALTKSDKLNQKEKSRQLKEFKAQCPWNFFWVSNLDKKGISDLEVAYFSAWIG